MFGRTLSLGKQVLQILGDGDGCCLGAMQLFGSTPYIARKKLHSSGRARIVELCRRHDSPLTPFLPPTPFGPSYLSTSRKNGFMVLSPGSILLTPEQDKETPISGSTHSSVDTCMRTHEYVHLTWKLQIWDLRLREGCCETAVLLVPFTQRYINGIWNAKVSRQPPLSVFNLMSVHDKICMKFGWLLSIIPERGKTLREEGAKNLFPVLFLGAEAESDRKQKKGERKGKLCLWGKTSNEGREQLRNLALLQQ